MAKRIRALVVWEILVNENKSDVDYDLNFLRDIERNAFSLILIDDAIYPKLKDESAYLSEILP